MALYETIVNPGGFQAGELCRELKLQQQCTVILGSECRFAAPVAVDPAIGLLLGVASSLNPFNTMGIVIPFLLFRCTGSSKVIPLGAGVGSSQFKSRHRFPMAS